MIQQIEFSLKPRRRGFHLITEEVMSHLSALPATGLVNLFVKHTSCALSVNENYDPSVRSDMEQIYNRLVREMKVIISIQMREVTICLVMQNVA